MFILLLACFFLLPACSAGSEALGTPPIPVWQDQFTSKFVVRVEKNGPDWSSDGVIYYDWTKKTFRTDYINWCLPPFYSGPTDRDNYTCTYLATGGSMYFVNHTASRWQDNQCCMFEKGLAAVPPDWVRSCQYNGTAVIRDIDCDVWWFPGTSDPSNPCYGYWDATDRINTPVRFFGVSPIGPTALDYTSYDVGPIQDSVAMDLPNDSSCFEQCKPPTKLWRKPGSTAARLKLIHFPSCEN